MTTVPQPVEPPHWVTTRVAHPVRDLARSEGVLPRPAGAAVPGRFRRPRRLRRGVLRPPRWRRAGAHHRPGGAAPGHRRGSVGAVPAQPRRGAQDGGGSGSGPAYRAWSQPIRTGPGGDEPSWTPTATRSVIAAVPPDPITAGPVRGRELQRPPRGAARTVRAGRGLPHPAGLLPPRRARPRRGRRDARHRAPAAGRHRAARTLRDQEHGGARGPAGPRGRRPARPGRDRPARRRVGDVAGGRHRGRGRRQPALLPAARLPDAVRGARRLRPRHRLPARDLLIDGIELRDRVWLDRAITGALLR